MLPDQIQLVEKGVVIFDHAELSIKMGVLFESPVRWRGHYKMHTLTSEAVHAACILMKKCMKCMNFPYSFFKSSGYLTIFGKSWQDILEHFGVQCDGWQVLFDDGFKCDRHTVLLLHATGLLEATRG